MSVSIRNPEGYIDLTAYEALRNVERGEVQMIPSYMPIVYICSPYAGDVEKNTQNARRYCRFAVDQGCLPIAPHLFFPQFMDDSIEAQRSLAMHMNMILLSKCDELWVFGRYRSSGMGMEIAQARRRGKHIHYFTTDCEKVS